METATAQIRLDGTMLHQCTAAQAQCAAAPPARLLAVNEAGARQALSNAAFDVEGRPMLLDMNAIPEFVRCAGTRSSPGPKPLEQTGDTWARSSTNASYVVDLLESKPGV